MARYKDWAMNIFCWDGILPFAVVALPLLIIELLPNQQAVGQVVALVVPMTAFFFRGAIGNKRFQRGEQFGWQKAFFCCGILILALFDCVYILFHSVPMVIGIADWLFLGGLYGAYLMVMSIALFPARAAFANN